MIRKRTPLAHTISVLSVFAPIFSPHITSLSPLQRNIIFANLLITKTVACLSPGPPRPLSSLPKLATPMLSPLTSLACMNLVSAASFPLLFLLTACAPFCLSLLVLSPLPPPTSPIRALSSASVSLHWTTAP